jgi:hypothetical protein
LSLNVWTLLRWASDPMHFWHLTLLLAPNGALAGIAWMALKKRDTTSARQTLAAPGNLYAGSIMALVAFAAGLIAAGLLISQHFPAPDRTGDAFIIAWGATAAGWVFGFALLLKLPLKDKQPEKSDALKLSNESEAPAAL